MSSPDQNVWVDFSPEAMPWLFKLYRNRDSSIDYAKWPDPRPLLQPPPPVMDISERGVPKFLWAYAKDVADRMRAPTDFTLAAGIVALASCVNRRAIVYPKLKDDWHEPLNLWGAVIAEPGAKKTPAISEMMKPIRAIEEEWHQCYEERLSQWRSAMEDYKDDLKKWKKTEQGERPEPPIIPKMSRLYTSDATMEKLHELMGDNPAGISIYQDELTALFALMDRDGRQGERQFHLSAHAGKEKYRIDRIGRGSVEANVCESVLGGMQPEPMRRYLIQGDRNDGMIQRLQIAVWPDSGDKGCEQDRTPNRAAYQIYERVLKTLVQIEMQTRVRMRREAANQVLYWLDDLEKEIGSSELHPAYRNHLGKSRSLMPKIAALFQLADLAARGEKIGSVVFVDEEHVNMAASCCCSLKTHANRIYVASITSPEIHTAERLLTEMIRTGRLDKEFSARRVQSLHRTGLRSSDEVHRALRFLEDHNWVHQMTVERRRGRPPDMWEVNPKGFYLNADVA